jgi:amidase
MTEPSFLTATEAIELIKQKKLSRYEWIQSCIKRIKGRETITQAWTFVNFDEALKQAKKLDDINSEKFGIPIGAKDIIDVSGMPTQMGTSFYENNIPARDSASVAIAKDAGCIVIGKTVTTELGHRHPGPTTNPHNPKYTPGGSSSGSAASVADFMVPIAFGTQTTGSIIRPASYCGVIGYKPTYGDFDKSGILPNSPSVDTLGLMARSIEDIQLMRNIVIEEKINLDKKIQLKQIKFAFVKTPYWEDQTDGCTKNELEKFVLELKKLKFNVDEQNLDELIIKSSEIHAKLSGFEFKRSIATERINHFDKLSEILRKGRLSDGDNMSLQGYRELQKDLDEIKSGIEERLKQYDCIITPSAPGEALKGLDYTGSPIFNTTWTLTGMPAVTLPLFKSKNNLPIGCQLVCHRDNDGLLLEVSKIVLKEFN